MNSGQNNLHNKRNKGFALITALLIIMIISAIAASMVYTTMTEGKIGGSDLQVNQAQYAAEAEMEKLTSDVDGLFSTTYAPTKAQVDGLTGSANWPNPADFPGVTYNNTISFPGCLNATALCSTEVVLNSGADAGLSATIVPLQINVTAIMPAGATVSLSRYVNIALIPVFQFGAFYQNDLTLMSSPDFNFAGNIHTNGNLFVADGGTLTLHGVVSALGDVHRDYLENGVAVTSGGFSMTGNVLVPTQPNGCDPGSTASTCRNLAYDATGLGGNPEGSRTGGLPGTVNGRWGSGATYLSGTNASASVYKTMLENGATGGRNLQLPFVDPNAVPPIKPEELIRIPKTTDTQGLQQSRMFNLATIRVLLADTEAQLPCGTGNMGSVATCAAGDLDNVPIGNSLGSGTSTIGWSVGSVAGVTCTAGLCGTNVTLPNVGSGSVSDNVSQAGISAPAWNTTYWAQGVGMYAGSGQPIGGSGSVSKTYACCSPGYGTGATTGIGGAGAGGVASGKGVGVDVDWQAVTEAAADYLGGNNTNWVPYDNYFTACSPSLQGCAAVPQGTPHSAVISPPASTIRTYTWPLIKGWLRVEANVVSGNTTQWTGMTRTWLTQGFARGLNPPCSAAVGVVAAIPCGSGQNTVHPNAIIILQELADHNNDQVASTTSYNGSANQFNWFPINFYDAREGELRNFTTTPASYTNTGHAYAGTALTQWNTSCGVNGIMNVVEIDVANLQAWINNFNGGSPGACGGNGQLNCLSQNGYILYFADVRDRTSTDDTSDLEDLVNSGNSSPTTDAHPNGTLETGEDVAGTGSVNMSGATFMGVGFGWGSGTSGASTIGLPVWQDRTACENIGRKYHVTGPRHALRLVNGNVGNLPYTSTGGGFTVSAWNPVYVWGNYNAGSASWGPSTCPGDAAHGFSSSGTWSVTCPVPASIIADAVTNLSANYSDILNLNNPTSYNNRNAVSSYYNYAVSGGSNKAYPTIAGSFDGTGGGVSNLVRLLEDWTGSSYHYLGSIVSFYYAQYATGIYKPGSSGGGNYSPVYAPPQSPFVRDYAFNINFTNPSMLPPGTPRFKDVNNVGFAQNYNPN